VTVAHSALLQETSSSIFARIPALRWSRASKCDIDWRGEFEIQFHFQKRAVRISNSKPPNWVLSGDVGAKIHASTATGGEKPVEAARIKETLALLQLWSRQAKVAGGDTPRRKMFWTIGRAPQLGDQWNPQIPRRDPRGRVDQRCSRQ